MADDVAPGRPLRVLVYSDDRTVRASVLTALGTRPSEKLPELELREVATEPMVIRLVDSEHFDLVILDGEAVPAGGIGIARQLKDEVFACPPILILTGRPADAWLATWSRAEAAVPHPIDPGQLVDTVTALLAERIPPAVAR